MATHNNLGKKGEELAVKYLRDKKYRILQTNWYYKKAEVDIIALKNNTLVVVEVKTRTSNYFGNPQDFISKKKIKLLTFAINEYVISNNLEVEVRFDIIAITTKPKLKLEHIKDAFLFF